MLRGLLLYGVLALCRRQFHHDAEIVMPEAIANEMALKDAIEGLGSNESLYALFGADWCNESRRLVHEIWKSLKNRIYIDIDQPLAEGLVAQYSVKTIPSLLKFVNKQGLIETHEYNGPSNCLNFQLWDLGITQKRRIPLVTPDDDLCDYMDQVVLLSERCAENVILRKLGYPPSDIPIAQERGIREQTPDCVMYWRGQAYNNITSWNQLLNQLKTPLQMDAANVNWLNHIDSDQGVLILVHPDERNQQLTLTLNSLCDSPKILCYELQIDTPFQRRFIDFIGLSDLGFQDEPGLVYLKPSRLIIPQYSSIAQISGSQYSRFTTDSFRNRVIYRYRGSDLTDAQAIRAWLNGKLHCCYSVTSEVEGGTISPDGERCDGRNISYGLGPGITELDSRMAQRLFNYVDRNAVMLLWSPYSWHSSMVLREYQKVAERFAGFKDISFVTLNLADNSMPALRTLNDNGKTEYRPVAVSGLPTILIKLKNDMLFEYPGDPQSADAIFIFLKNLHL